MSATRAKRTDADLVELGENLAQHDWLHLIKGSIVACYVSTSDEPMTSQLRTRLKSLGVEVYLPIMKPERTLAWGLDNGQLKQNSVGIFEPEESLFTPDSASVLIVPALVVGRDGSRLGRGAGYYDRFLAQVPTSLMGGPPRIAIVFDDEVLDSVPHDANDQPIDVIVTPTQIYQVNA